MKSDYMKFELNDNETFLGVYKDDPDCVMFSLHNNGDFLPMIYSLDEVTLWTDDIKIGVRY